MTIAVPYEWLRQVPLSLLEEEAPLGSPPPFPWDQLGTFFAKMFQLESFVLKPSLWKRRLPDELYEGFGGKVLPLFVELASLSGDLCFIMSDGEVDRLMNLLLAHDPNSIAMMDPDYRQGFYQFMALEVFNIFTKLNYANGVLPHLLEKTDLPSTSSLCQDIAFEAGGITFTARMILSDELTHSWKERFTEHTLKVLLPEDVSEKIQVIVHLEAGHVTLSKKEWMEASSGDFLLLDQCTLENEGEKGRVILTLDGKPLYRAKIKDGNVKILESPFFHEISTNITPQLQKEAPLGDTFDDEFSEFDDDFTDIEETKTEAVQTPVKVKEAFKDVDEAPLEESEDKALETDEGKLKSIAAAKPINLQDIPLTVVIEVGRLQISVGKLMALEPGNLLDLNIHPENGVDLVVNGNVIGKGELLKIGDSLGVRIFDKV
ncbi:MAG: type III secretion system cytoplasmic ring protein SctQ [Parachlamydiaceae bacterium]|nr:type III secretion system cytoplasmic ring protein SctQ [Parachlamydiaceae bacterium]